MGRVEELERPTGTGWATRSNLERPLAATSSTRSTFRRDTSMIWSGRAQQGQVAVVTWSDLVERRSVPALGPTSRRQLSRTGTTKTERGGYIARQIHEVRREPERRPGARWRIRCEAGATHWSGVTNPRARSIFGRFFMFFSTFSDLFLRLTRFLGVL